ncbi:MAG: AAA family ATPase [Candidatus Eisenbacteria bacterium]|uniref:AAA family ATPase n=1 Tax=Eiseniibacteriota bacterium TaxID=2212470 RepID=A0A933SE72_UNCEI|nr:AAA family ATPase [Candidatus Eisenbacteria bacterium]
MSELPIPSGPALDPAELLRTMMRRKWLLLLPWLAALAIGVSAAFLLKPVYFSTTLLLLDRGQAMQGPLGSISGGPDVEQQADIMREQVQSSLFLRSVVAATGVKEDRATRAWALKSASKYPGLSQDEQVEAFLVDQLRTNISIKRSKGKLFQVQVADFDSERARKFCEAVSNQFVASSKARQLEAVQAQQEFSVEQLQVYKRALQEAEMKLEGARRAVISSSIGATTVNGGNLSFALSLQEQASVDAEDQRQRVADLRSQFPGRLKEGDAQQLSSPDVNALVGQMASLQNQLGRAMLNEVSLTGGSSARVALARKTSELEFALAEAAARALPNASPEARDLAVRYRLAQADLNARESWRAWISSQVDGYQRERVMAPNRELDISRLQAEVDQARSLYNAFQQQSAAAQIAEAFQNAKVSGRFVIMEPATRPASPGKPNRPLLVLMALVVGGIIGVGTVLVVEHHDQSVRNAEEVEQMLGLPVLGAIPRVEELARVRKQKTPVATGATAPGALPASREAGLIQRLKVESPLGLEFKRIYLNLARTRGRTLPRTILITSSTRGEGKTTTSACLGITLAREHRQKTLLVDFDLRSPALHRALGMPGSSWGLAQMLHQHTFDERFVRQTALPMLDFLAAGRSERPAAELIDAENVDWFLKEAMSRYELIVLDCAPCLAVPDPLILGRAVEGVLYVIKAGATVRKAAEYGVKVQREARDNVLGVLMNDAGEFMPQYYGYKANYYGYTTEAVEG